MEYLFRIRNVETLLYKHQELETQTIYFATPEELNDGYEGLPNIAWLGDEYTWNSLLMMFISFAKKKGDFGATSEAFEFEIGRIIKCLGDEQECLVANENFMFYLLSKILEAKSSDAQSGKIFDDLNSLIRLLKEFDADNTEAERFLLEYRHYNSAMCAEHDIYGVALSYISYLENLLHPDWGVSCFMKECGIKNPSSWGYYGNAGKGAALIFEPRTDVSLHGQRYRFGRSGGIVLSRQKDDHHTVSIGLPFCDVTYSNEKDKISFFESMGKMRQEDIDEWCSLGLDKSVMLNVENGISDFKQKQLAYGGGFLKSKTTKSEGWAHEGEKRLILSEFSLNASLERKNRILKYRFESLKGIIFGPYMDKKDKQKIVDIIAKKCREEARDSFIFRQAFYDPKSGDMSFVDLDFLCSQLEINTNPEA